MKRKNEVAILENDSVVPAKKPSDVSTLRMIMLST